MLLDLALSTANLNLKFISGSPPPCFAASTMSLLNLVNKAPRLASVTPFARFIVDHLECPDISFPLSLLCVLVVIINLLEGQPTFFDQQYPLLLLQI